MKLRPEIKHNKRNMTKKRSFHGMYDFNQGLGPLRASMVSLFQIKYLTKVKKSKKLIKRNC